MERSDFRDKTGEVDEKGRVIYDSVYRKREVLNRVIKAVLEMRKTTGDKDVVFNFNTIEITVNNKDNEKSINERYKKAMDKRYDNQRKKDAIWRRKAQKKADLIVSKLDSVSGHSAVLKWLEKSVLSFDKIGVEFNGKEINNKLAQKGYSEKDAVKIKITSELDAVTRPDDYARYIIGLAMQGFARGVSPNPNQIEIANKCFHDPAFAKARHAMLMEQQSKRR